MDSVASAEPLQAWLERREGTRLYRLIDPTSAPDRALNAAQLEKCGVIHNPFFDDPLTRRMYLQPVPVRSSELSIMVAQELASLPGSRTQPVGFCGWIATRAHVRIVAAHMEKQLSVTSPQGKACLLRFHDPRVLERLEDILDPQQLSRLLGPIDNWWYFDHRQQLKELSPTEHQRGLGRPTVTETQWSAIKRIADINRILELCNSMEIENRYTPSPADIDQLMVIAERHGIHAYDDVALFAVHGLLAGMAFHQHPKLRQLLGSMNAGRGYSMVTECLSDDDWKQIAMECRENS